MERGKVETERGEEERQGETVFNVLQLFTIFYIFPLLLPVPPKLAMGCDMAPFKMPTAMIASWEVTL